MRSQIKSLVFQSPTKLGQYCTQRASLAVDAQPNQIISHSKSQCGNQIILATVWLTHLLDVTCGNFRIIKPESIQVDPPAPPGLRPWTPTDAKQQAEQQVIQTVQQTAQVSTAWWRQGITDGWQQGYLAAVAEMEANVAFSQAKVMAAFGHHEGAEANLEDEAQDERDRWQQAKAEVKAEARDEREAEVKVEAEACVQREAEVNVEAEACVQREAEVKVEAEACVQREAEVKVAADDQHEAQAEAEAGETPAEAGSHKQKQACRKGELGQQQVQTPTESGEDSGADGQPPAVQRVEEEAEAQHSHVTCPITC